MTEQQHEQGTLGAIDGGIRVRETEHFYVDILRMGFGNLRIVETYKSAPQEYRRGWCYQVSIDWVIAYAHTFDPEGVDYVLPNEPQGWVKEMGTQRYACAFLMPVGPHPGFDPECARCG